MVALQDRGMRNCSVGSRASGCMNTRYIAWEEVAMGFEDISVRI